MCKALARGGLQEGVHKPNVIQYPYDMKITIAILDCARWLAGIMLTMELPFAWILRDSLGPNAYETTGLEAVVRTLLFPGIRGLAIAFVVLSVAVRLLSGKWKAAKMSWYESASAFAVAFLLALLGVCFFRYCADRERQRRAEEHSEYMKCMDEALDQVIPSLSFEPPATFGDAIEFLDKFALNCLCNDGHDGKGRIRVVACVGKELLERPVPSMKAEQITVGDALRLLCESVGCRFKVDSANRTITITEKQAGDMENV